MVNITEPHATNIREQMLDLLRASPNSYISGQEISKHLGVSRTAIWKNVNALRSQGYVIESHPRLGHKLKDIPDLLLPLEIRARLKSKVFGRNVYHFASTGSTQEHAFELARKGASEGALVVAEEQTGGRGRRGRSYYSPRGGIWFSIVLRPPLPPRAAPVINLAAGVALADVMRELGLSSALLRWPNDVLAGGKKLSGILAEMSAEPDELHFVILGMGINANIEMDSFPEDLRSVATSLWTELGRRVDRVEVLCRVLEKLEKYYSRLLEEGSSSILAAWKSFPNMLGKPVRVSATEGVFEGVAMGLDEEGALLVKDNSGKERRLFAGDVSARGI